MLGEHFDGAVRRQAKREEDVRGVFTSTRQLLPSQMDDLQLYPEPALCQLVVPCLDTDLRLVPHRLDAVHNQKCPP